ncbi:MAG: helix-turn-helix domain-containing protein [Phycisphaerae bacterium]|nr:helix-turn-helix domain-containing protein [Phycisphaerae bacterium]
MNRPKEVLTTGEVARLCKVAPRTVSKWFDSGKLRGYRIPGSKDRRIPLAQLIRFMRAHNIPLEGLDSGTTRVLIVERDRSVAELLSNALANNAGYDVRVVHTAFEAGAVAQSYMPQVMLIDSTMPGLDARESLNAVRNVPELANCRLVALAGSSKSGEHVGLRQDGYDAVIGRPFEVSQVVHAIETSLGVAGAL